MTFYKFGFMSIMPDTGSAPESMHCMFHSSAMVSPFTYFSSLSFSFLTLSFSFLTLSLELLSIENLVVIAGLSILLPISLLVVSILA